MSPARFWLGMAQMGASTVALALLFWTGITTATGLAAALAATFTLVSRRLYHGRP
jgi:hypothetical protein